MKQLVGLSKHRLVDGSLKALAELDVVIELETTGRSKVYYATEIINPPKTKTGARMRHSREAINGWELSSVTELDLVSGYSKQPIAL